MEQWRETFGSALSSALPPADTRPAVVHEAMRYAALNGGKRLRAMLCISSCELFGSNPERALRPALAIEIFHASTLVHDDLPCMDDDDIRRGKPSTHIQFGEANALLAGNALLTLALEWMAQTPVPPPHPPGLLVTELAQAGGSEGVIGGQIEDLAAEQTPPNEDQLLYIHREKTARLIACACRVGAVCAGTCASKVDKIGRYGINLGMAFQILDDILDATQSTETLGKPAGSDEENHKLTSVSLWGLEGSRAKAQEYTQNALDILDELDPPTPRLRELTEWMLLRKN
jgi:geranylgeranyl diphosphate synthase type II